MKQILKAYADQILPPVLQEIRESRSLGGVLPASCSFLAAAIYDSESDAGSLVIVTASNQAAESLAAESLLYLPARSIAYFPGYESIPYEYSGVGAEVSLQRIRVLSRLLGGERMLVFASADALLRKIPAPARLKELSMRLKVDDEREPRALMRQLIAMGYQREERVEAPGQFALKGSVLDLYPVNLDEPVRLDYFDDLIETIRVFDADTQLGAKQVKSVTILPAGEVVLDSEESAALRERLQKLSAAAKGEPLSLPPWAAIASRDSADSNDTASAASAENFGSAGDADFSGDTLSQFHHPGVEELFPAVLPAASFLDAFESPPTVLMYPAPKVREAVARIKREFHSLYQRENSERVCLPPGELLDDFPGEHPVAALHELARSQVSGEAESAGDNAPQSRASDDPDQDEAASADGDPDADDADPIAVSGPTPGTREVTGFGGRISEVRARIQELIADGARICITSPYSAQMRRIAGIFKQEPGLNVQIHEDARETAEEARLPGEKKRPKAGASNGAGLVFDALEPAGNKKKTGKQASNSKTKKNTLHILRAAQQQGFYVPELNFYVLTDAEIFGRTYKRRSRFKKLGTVPIESFLDLKEGDHVVHVTHGVGRFLKLEKVRAAGRERDFLVLEYAEADKLFVPLDQISMVQRYIAPTDKPRLDHLGKASFKKIRERVEQKIEEFAGELVKLYAVRMSKRGFQYPPDTVWQEEFEAEFPYEETPDQITAIEAVKRDMEAPQPMDRLICGDVGYGKTEVAIRAAFKAVMAGRQVAIIAPTTILALQHFRNIRERYRNYPISIDWISRFRSRAEIKEVKQQLLKGELDVVVGTHGLLSKDVHIKNLGLLIVDEEQRFGVSHKEAIKKMRNLVDVLTLSATPIPRTLHMSLVGIREISVIQTPPVDRRPVETHVMENSDSIIREAISRELKRDGQVFFLHNRIETIESLALRVQELAPDVRIAVLHGQMLEEEIEDILVQFMERKFDLLITTAIIENGIDMPNVNTLLVDRAEMFGLSQLYQIRGRVGRAGRQAYAYMLYEPARVLTETAQKRLNTILEYQELGSGFKVAMRDLEIRGAGNVIGKEQSGQIMDVGYELYVKLLEDAVKRVQGANDPEALPEVRSTINLSTDFYLPEEYIPDTRQRIEFYKRFEAARDEAEVDAVSTEMENRFGRLPEAALVFVQVEKIRALASNIGFEEVYQEDTGRIRMRTGEHLLVPPQHIVSCLKKIRGLSVQPGTPNTLHWTPEARRGPTVLSGVSDDDAYPVDLEEVISVLRRLAEPAVARRARENAATAGAAS
ncbi:MAG: transcription-repair coupling factor [bacterium]|nr:transcription-repair coupling factor [bacterium]